MAIGMNSSRRAPVLRGATAHVVNADCRPVRAWHALAFTASLSWVPWALAIVPARPRRALAVRTDPRATLPAAPARFAGEGATGIVLARLLPCAALQATRFIAEHNVAGALVLPAFPGFTDLMGGAAETVAAKPRAALPVCFAAEPRFAAALAALARLPSSGIGAAIAALGAPVAQLLADTPPRWTEARAALRAAGASLSHWLATSLSLRALVTEQREYAREYACGKRAYHPSSQDSVGHEALGQFVESFGMHGGNRSASVERGERRPAG